MNIMIRDVLTFLLGVTTQIKMTITTLLIRGLNYKNYNAVFLSSLKIKGSLNLVLNRGYVVKTRIDVYGVNNVIEFIGNVKVINCKFLIQGSNCTIKIAGGRIIKNSKFELLDSNTHLKVGQDTGFNSNRVVIAGEHNSINVGTGCIFAEDAELWASDTHSIIDIPTGLRINSDKPIVINDRVWVGKRALIMKGAELGSDSIVAAGSIVTKKTGANKLLAGLPAVVIRDNVMWDIRRL